MLDTGYTKNICGQTWWRDFHESLSAEDRNRVRMEDGGGKKFRFGGGEVLMATKQVKFPVKLAGREVMMSSHVVNSPIPLLWSKPSMIKALNKSPNILKSRRATVSLKRKSRRQKRW